MLFKNVFNTMRLQSQVETLTQLASLLAEENCIIEESVLSKWKNGHRTPRSRKTIFALVSIFISRGGIRTIEQINILLLSCLQHELTHTELGHFRDKLYTPTLNTDKLYLAYKILGKPFVQSHFSSFNALISTSKNTDQYISILRHIEDHPEKIHEYILNSELRIIKEKNRQLSGLLTPLSYTYIAHTITNDAWRSQDYTFAPFLAYRG